MCSSDLNRALDLLTLRLESSPESGYERVVTTDFNSFLFRPYSPNDQLMFGSIETIFRFWSANLKRISDISSTQEDFAEKVLLRTYLEDQGLTFDNSHLQSLEIYRDLYSFIDNEDLNLYWNKGTHRSLASRFPQQVFPSEFSFVRFTDWMRLQYDLGPYLNAYTRMRGLPVKEN